MVYVCELLTYDLGIDSELEKYTAAFSGEGYAVK